MFTRKADFTGGWITDVMIFNIGDYGYVCGGSGEESLYIDSCYRYDPDADSWSDISALPVATYSGFGFSVGGYGYIVGGIIDVPGVGGAYTDNVWRYDPELDSWTPMNAFSGGARVGIAGFVIDDVAYIGTGWTGFAGDWLYDLWRYNEETDTWTAMSGLAADEKRAYAYGFAINESGYIAGGNYSSYDKYTSVYKYDPGPDTWSASYDLPLTASTLSNGVHPVLNDKAYLIRCNTVFEETVGDHIFIFDPSSGAERAVEAYPGYAESEYNTPISVVQIGDRIFCGLGYSTQWWEYEPGFPADAIAATCRIACKNDSDYDVAHDAIEADLLDEYFAIGEVQE